jgi:hypothetical protein
VTVTRLPGSSFEIVEPEFFRQLLISLSAVQ